VEITLRTDAGLEALSTVAGRADVVVGAGTVTSTSQVDRVVAAGARFVVTPGFDRAVVERCLHHGVPVLPGVATPGEVMAAMGLGIDVVKVFPAGLLGGPPFADALAGPFPRLRIVPSGGVTRENAAGYLAKPNVLAVSGTWVTPPGARDRRDPQVVTASAAATVVALGDDVR
jgi:2-dehydro-3-deoxyphosphogluconate aldolase/(4S)-4-hydroxy-2-oxoglutarate aldolase